MSKILYQNSNHYVIKTERGNFEVYRNEGCAAVRVAIVGKGDAPNLGIARAIRECDRREA